MEINETTKKSTATQTVVNPEGSLVLDRLPEVQLYLEASNLKLRTDSFYSTADEKLESFLTLAQEVTKKNPEYVLGLAKFLADNGLRLSPVILLATLSNNHYSFRNENVKFVFNTPQRIAEAVALRKKLPLNNSFLKHALKESLENMNSFTLRKNKMLRRKVKLRDLINYLRPKPINEDMSKLYKAIIENAKEAKMAETETFVRVKSSKKIDKKDYKEREQFKRTFMKVFAKSLKFEKPIFTPEELRLLVSDCMAKGMRIKLINMKETFGLFDRIKDTEDIFDITFTWK